MPDMAMVEDATRTGLFREAITRRLRGRCDQVVIDIGTGPFAILALFAAQAGARRVFAVEANPSAAEQAKASVAAAESAGLVPLGVIEVIEGFSADVHLPEPADLVVAEIVGDIATEEGLVPTMRDAQQRHLKRPYDRDSYIPQQVQTWCAPASYILPSILRPPHSELDFAELRGGDPIRVGCDDAAVQVVVASSNPPPIPSAVQLAPSLPLSHPEPSPADPCLPFLPHPPFAAPQCASAH